MVFNRNRQFQKYTSAVIDFIGDEFEPSLQCFPLMALLQRLEVRAVHDGTEADYLAMLDKLAEHIQARTMGVSWQDIFALYGIDLEGLAK